MIFWKVPASIDIARSAVELTPKEQDRGVGLTTKEQDNRARVRTGDGREWKMWKCESVAKSSTNCQLGVGEFWRVGEVEFLQIPLEIRGGI